MVPVTDSEKSTDNHIEKLNGTMSSSNSMRSSSFSEVLNDQNSDLNDTSPKSLQPTNKNFITLPGQPDQLVDVGRVRMLLQNFVLIRILVGHVLLSPWGSSICRKPSKRKNRIIYNCRMTATLIYEVVQKMDALKNLPPIGSEVRSPSVDQGFKTMTGRLSIKRTSSARKLKGNSMIEEQSTTVEEEPQSRMLLIFEKLFGLQSTKLELDDRKSSLERPRGEVEDQLLASRNNFEPLPTLHGYLLKPATLITARPLIDEWISGCSEALDDWMSKLVLHVLKRRAKRKERKIMAT